MGGALNPRPGCCPCDIRTSRRIEIAWRSEREGNCFAEGTHETTDVIQKSLIYVQVNKSPIYVKVHVELRRNIGKPDHPFGDRQDHAERRMSGRCFEDHCQQTLSDRLGVMGRTEPSRLPADPGFGPGQQVKHREVGQYSLPQPRVSTSISIRRWAEKPIISRSKSVSAVFSSRHRRSMFSSVIVGSLVGVEIRNKPCRRPAMATAFDR